MIHFNYEFDKKIYICGNNEQALKCNSFVITVVATGLVAQPELHTCRVFVFFLSFVHFGSEGESRKRAGKACRYTISVGLTGLWQLQLLQSCCIEELAHYHRCIFSCWTHVRVIKMNDNWLVDIVNLDLCSSMYTHTLINKDYNKVDCGDET